MFAPIGESLTQNSWFNDQRLCVRFGKIITSICDNFGHSLPQSIGNKSQIKAAYNFMNNDKVSPEGICSGDAYRLKERVRSLEPQTFLGMSDTSGLNYSTSKSSERLDCLVTDKQKGFFLHTLMLTDASGCPEGLLRNAFFNRKPEDLGKVKRMDPTERSKVPVEDKESYRWLEDFNALQTLFAATEQHRFIHVTDSEGDMFEVFSLRRYAHIHVLTRVHHDRKLTDGTHNIKSYIRQTPVQGQITVKVTERKKTVMGKTDKTRVSPEKVQRTAVLEIRFAPVKIAVPEGLKTYHKNKDYKPLDLFIVCAKEILPGNQLPEGCEPIEWYLITSIPVGTTEQAAETISFYASRWRIEDFHLVLKEGAKIENLQYEDAPQLRNAVSVYSVAAIQVLRLRCMAQTQGDKPMEILGIDVKAFDVIATFLKKVKKIKTGIPEQPTVKNFLNLITILGSGNPNNTGVRALWRGLRDFNLIYDTFCMLDNDDA